MPSRFYNGLWQCVEKSFRNSCNAFGDTLAIPDTEWIDWGRGQAHYCKGHCVISYRAGTWHYRIFADFLKIPSSRWRTVRKHVPYEEIFADINSENLPKLSKEKLQSFCNVRKLKVSDEKKELVQRLEPLSRRKQLFDRSILLRLLLHLQVGRSLARTQM